MATNGGPQQGGEGSHSGRHGGGEKEEDAGPRVFASV